MLPYLKPLFVILPSLFRAKEDVVVPKRKAREKTSANAVAFFMCICSSKEIELNLRSQRRPPPDDNFPYTPRARWTDEVGFEIFKRSANFLKFPDKYPLRVPRSLVQSSSFSNRIRDPSRRTQPSHEPIEDRTKVSGMSSFWSSSDLEACHTLDIDVSNLQKGVVP